MTNTVSVPVISCSSPLHSLSDKEDNIIIYYGPLYTYIYIYIVQSVTDNSYCRLAVGFPHALMMEQRLKLAIGLTPRRVCLNQ